MAIIIGVIDIYPVEGGIVMRQTPPLHQHHHRHLRCQIRHLRRHRRHLRRYLRRHRQ